MTDTVEIEPLDRPPDAVVEVPGSKSITNRALVLAALADGPSRIENALFSDDTRYMAASLSGLGIEVTEDEAAARYEVAGAGGMIPARKADLFIGNAGTAARFLTAVVALGHGVFRIDGVRRMRQRPIGDLLDALQQLGVDARSEEDNGCPPIVVHADGLRGGIARIRADVSSQYVSAILMVAPLSADGVELHLEGELVSEPYVDLTARMMEQWGVQYSRPDGGAYHVPGGQRYRAQTYRVEPDASSASYFLAAAAVTGGRVRVPGLGPNALQGDVGFADVLREMGCSVEIDSEGIDVRGPERLRGIDVDMNAVSDTVMTLAAIAPFADGPTRIRNVAHIRHKESDRIRALVTELRRLGVCAEEHDDGLTIQPCDCLAPAVVQTYDDHRMAMSFAVAGLRAPGIRIADPDCVAKTFPDFFERLRLLGARR